MSLAALVALVVVVAPVAPDKRQGPCPRPRDPEALTGPARLEVGPPAARPVLQQQQPAQSAPARAEAKSAVLTALSFRGVRYRYAGMSSRGFDCSGFISRVLLAHGVRAPHSSRAMFGLGQRVSFEQLRPGDLLFFSTRGRGISHVGMYIGEGKFVHSSSGRGVVVDTLRGDYYAGRLVGARRVF